jgi:hypothetical protein
MACTGWTLALVVALSSAAAGVAQDTILLDTYQDDVIGNPPNGPEIGTYFQLVGTHMVDDFGGGDLKVLSMSSAGSGYLINMAPIATPPVVRTTYEYEVLGNSQLTGLNALSQQWVLRPIGNNLTLWWGNDFRLRVNISRASGPSATIDTGFNWSFDTEYDIEMVTDGTTDTFSLRVNGSDVLLSEPFGEDFTHAASLAFLDNFSSATLRILNDVRMTNEACATESTPPIAELTSPPHLGTGCTCADPAITGTADDPEVGLGSYTLEYRPASGGAWQTFETGDTAVVNNVLGVWPTGSLSEGIYNIRLTVTNACGLSASDVRTIFLDKVFSSLELRSPGKNAIVGRRVCLDGTVFDSYCFDQYVAEYRPAGGGAWQPVDPANPVYTSTVVNDPFAFWDTDVLGVADGDYQLRVIAETDCGNTDSTQVTVIVDNTAPIARIDAPTNCAIVLPGDMVKIVGEVFDANLDGWTLAVTGGPYNGWQPITPVLQTNNVNGVLWSWDTSGLPPCAYTIRLRATDESILDCGPFRHVTEYYVSISLGITGDADLDGDGDVDIDDFELFQLAFTGPQP